VRGHSCLDNSAKLLALWSRGILHRFHTDVKDFTCLEELMDLWFDMARLLNEEHLDPSYYSVFRGLLEDWVKRSSQRHLSGLTTHVQSELHRLSSSVALSTGISMSVIWEVARPAVPSNLDQWNAYDRLLRIVDGFDNAVALQIGTANISASNDRKS
jgi:midasin (ATPase involved in ribosome maturation)